MLKILLFAPESPIVTRGSIGDVDALSQEERLIHSIDVWVFEHLSPDKKVGYIHQEGLSFDGQREISMEISDEFANLTNKPNDDDFVLYGAAKPQNILYLFWRRQLENLCRHNSEQIQKIQSDYILINHE